MAMAKHNELRLGRCLCRRSSSSNARTPRSNDGLKRKLHFVDDSNDLRRHSQSEAGIISLSQLLLLLFLPTFRFYASAQKQSNFFFISFYAFIASIRSAVPHRFDIVGCSSCSRE